MKVYVDEIPIMCGMCLFYKNSPSESYDYTYHKCKLTNARWATEEYNTNPHEDCPLVSLKIK